MLQVINIGACGVQDGFEIRVLYLHTVLLYVSRNEIGEDSSLLLLYYNWWVDDGERALQTRKNPHAKGMWVSNLRTACAAWLVPDRTHIQP